MGLALHIEFLVFMSIDLALKALAGFRGASLAKRLALFEYNVVGRGTADVQLLCREHSIDTDFMSSAATVKAATSQIDVIIHAAGILCCLPHLLSPGEVVEEVSLGAGNTGKLFDLTTSHRIAEFKFIHWQGGSETIRQNSLFKDFFSLAECSTNKSKHLYVLGTTFPLKFFRGGRALHSVLSKQPDILKIMQEKYAGVLTVREYYNLKQNQVEIRDVSPHISGPSG